MPDGQPRTLDEIRAHLLDLLPSFASNPEELAHALYEMVAAVAQATEAAVYTLHDRRYITRADGSWLDEHGRERGIIRFENESDADYLIRIQTIEDQVTKPAIVALVDRLLAIGTARMEEWLPDGAFADILDARGFSDVAVAHGALRGFTIYISEQLGSLSNRGFALADPADPFQDEAGDYHTFAGADGDPFDVSAFAEGTDPTPSDIYARIWNEIERVRAGGLGPPPHFIVEFE